MANKLTSFIQKFIQWFPKKGGLVSDVAPADMNNGNLYLTIPETGAMNVRAVGDGTNVSLNYEVIKGNKYIYTPDPVVVQNRIFRLAIDVEFAYEYGFLLMDANGASLATWSFTTGSVPPLVVGDIVTSLANLITVTNAALTAEFFTISSSVTGTNTGYVTVEISTVPYWDYNITMSILGANVPPVYGVTVIQEAVDESMLGYWRPTGSDDRTGDEWHKWTTRTTLPTEFTITDVADDGFGLIEITTALPNNILSNYLVQIKNVLGTTEANGIWITTSIDATHFILQGSVFTNAYISGGTAISFIFGLGEIGVGVKNENDQTWIYTRLLRSKEFNFSTLKQIDCRVKRKQDLNKADYFTDNFNNYRVFYYKGAYITDGGLAINGGHYTYGTIARELLLDQNSSDFDLTFLYQIQTGGGVRSGNWRYTARFGTETALSFTIWGFLTNPVPVAGSSEAGSGKQFFGNPPGTPTSKQNVLQITNPIPGLFKYVEIAAINYLSSGFTGEIIGRYLLTGTATQQIIHTGKELSVQDLDIGTLNNVLASVRYGRNIELLNNHLIKSNLTLNPTIDFTDFVKTFTYQIKRKVVNGNSTGSFINDTLAVGEFMLSQNVYSEASLMLNERYRTGFQFMMHDGTITPAFHAYDIIINTDNTQAGCTGALLNFDLTNLAIGIQEVYTFYIEWGGFDLNFVIDGVRVGDIIAEIIPMRCEVINKQVQAGGFLLPAVRNIASGAPGFGSVYWVDPNNLASTTGELGEWVFPAGIDEAVLNFPNINYLYGASGGGTADFTYDRRFAAPYFPDVFYGHTQINPAPGDIIINYGQPTMARSNYPITPPLAPYDNDYYAETNGETNNPPDLVYLLEGATIDKGSSATIGGFLFSKKLKWTRPAFVFPNWDAAAGMAVYANPAQPVGGTATFRNLTGNTDIGIYNCQYYTPLTADVQYGAIADSKYIKGGDALKITDNTPATFDMTAGDCFTQATYFKDRYPTDVTQGVFGQGFRIYSQNRSNTQMKNPNNGTGTPTAFTASNGNNDTEQINTWLNNVNLESLSYNEGYTIRYEIVNYAAFDPNGEYQTDWGNVIWWSQPEAEGSVTDNLRIFMPLDIKFEDYTFGYVTEFKNVNEEAIVVQQRKIIREYFNDNAVLTTKEGSEVITGDGGIMNQKGRTVTTYGSSNKWSVLIGKNNRGNEVLYCIDPYNKVILRYGYNGTDVISELQGIKAFCANNMQFVIGKDTPAHEQGIHGVANLRFREVIWTLRGWKDGIQQWTQPSFADEHVHDDITGNAPYGDLLNVNGVLYGTTALGGATTGGVIFKYDPATGIYTDLFEFTFGSALTGYEPNAGLCLAGDGLLYGVTNRGGANGVGVIFSFDMNSLVCTNLFDMVLATGGNPVGELIEFNGKLYGQASTGGANTFGCIYEWDYTGVAYADVYDFAAIDGKTSQGKLYTDGTFLYGLTGQGGALNGGTLFQFDLVTFNKLHDFAIGSLPLKAVTAIGSVLYGTTTAGIQTSFNQGVLFSYDLNTATYTVLWEFTQGNPGTDGTEPMCTPTVVGTKLFGTARTGGAAGYGVIWSFDTMTNIYTKLIDFNIPDIYPRGQMVLIGNILYGNTVGTIIVNFGTLYSYSLNGYYVTGNVVTYGTVTFEELPAFYIALQDNVSVPPPGRPDDPEWALIPTTDNNYYNVYTLVYNELKDIFQMFMTPKPRIYSRYLDHYLDHRPVGDTGMVYESNKGSDSPPEWFNDGSTSEIGEAYFDAVFNEPNIMWKTYASLHYISDTKPDRVEVTTLKQFTYMDGADIETREDQHEVAVMNDATVTAVGLDGAVANPLGLNDLDTSKLWGQYAIVRTIMRSYNKIATIIMKVRYRSRNPLS